MGDEDDSSYQGVALQGDRTYWPQGIQAAYEDDPRSRVADHNVVVDQNGMASNFEEADSV